MRQQLVKTQQAAMETASQATYVYLIAKGEKLLQVVCNPMKQQLPLNLLSSHQ